MFISQWENDLLLTGTAFHCLLAHLFTSDFCFLIWRSSPPDVFLGKAVLKICSKATGEHPYRSVISVKLKSNFFEITLRHGVSPLNLLHIHRTPFYENISRGLPQNFFNLDECSWLNINDEQLWDVPGLWHKI